MDEGGKGRENSTKSIKQSIFNEISLSIMLAPLSCGWTWVLIESISRRVYNSSHQTLPGLG